MVCYSINSQMDVVVYLRPKRMVEGGLGLKRGGDIHGWYRLAVFYC